jgi:hypothetical protein
MSKFNNFWSSKVFIMNLMNLKAYEYFLKGLTNFTWIWKPNSNSSLEFKTWYKSSKFHVWIDSNRIQTLFEFELEFYSKP